MGVYVFNNEIFDSWLNKKADEILSKVNREMITTEEMIVLILKAQTNHFSHMDHDLKLAIQKSHDEIGLIREDNEKLENSLRGDMTKMEAGIRSDMDLRFNIVDKRFDRVYTLLQWSMGIMTALFGGVYLKLFLG